MALADHGLAYGNGLGVGKTLKRLVREGLLKEDMIPKGADRVLYVLAPALVLASILGAMAVLPLAPDFYFADIDLGIFVILARVAYIS